MIGYLAAFFVAAVAGFETSGALLVTLAGVFSRGLLSFLSFFCTKTTSTLGLIAGAAGLLTFLFGLFEAALTLDLTGDLLSDLDGVASIRGAACVCLGSLAANLTFVVGLVVGFLIALLCGNFSTFLGASIDFLMGDGCGFGASFLADAGFGW